MTPETPDKSDAPAGRGSDGRGGPVDGLARRILDAQRDAGLVDPDDDTVAVFRRGVPQSTLAWVPSSVAARVAEDAALEWFASSPVGHADPLGDVLDAALAAWVDLPEDGRPDAGRYLARAARAVHARETSAYRDLVAASPDLDRAMHASTAAEVLARRERRLATGDAGDVVAGQDGADAWYGRRVVLADGRTGLVGGVVGRSLVDLAVGEVDVWVDGGGPNVRARTADLSVVLA